MFFRLCEQFCESLTATVWRDAWEHCFKSPTRRTAIKIDSTSLNLSSVLNNIQYVLLFISQCFRCCFHLRWPQCVSPSMCHSLHNGGSDSRPIFPEAENQRLICTKPWTLNPSQTLINALGVWDHTEVVSLSWAQTPALCLTEGSYPSPILPPPVHPLSFPL